MSHKDIKEYLQKLCSTKLRYKISLNQENKMAISLASLKKSSKDTLAALKKHNEEQNTKKSFDDKRFWKPMSENDSSGNPSYKGSFTIRFLPCADADVATHEALTYEYGFPYKGSWFIENSLYTIKQPDPVFQLKTRLTATGLASDKALMETFKSKAVYIANILVVSDPFCPENEGKVFLFKYGNAIHKMLDKRAFPNPEDYDEDEVVPEGVDPFNVFDGCDFRLIMKPQLFGKDSKGKDRFVPNYDMSKFKDVTQLAPTDERMEEIISQVHSLKEFTDPKNFKTYEEQVARLVEVLGEEVGSGVPVRTVQNGSTTPSKNTSSVTTSKSQEKRTVTQMTEEEDSEETSAEDELAFLDELTNS